MTPQLENAIASAQSLSVAEQRELLGILSQLVNESEADIEPTADEIAASLHRALHEVETGQTIAISQLWEGLDEE